MLQELNPGKMIMQDKETCALYRRILPTVAPETEMLMLPHSDLLSILSVRQQFARNIGESFGHRMTSLLSEEEWSTLGKEVLDTDIRDDLTGNTKGEIKASTRLLVDLITQTDRDIGWLGAYVPLHDGKDVEGETERGPCSLSSHREGGSQGSEPSAALTDLELVRARDLHEQLTDWNSKHQDPNSLSVEDPFSLYGQGFCARDFIEVMDRSKFEKSGDLFSRFSSSCDQFLKSGEFTDQVRAEVNRDLKILEDTIGPLESYEPRIRASEGTVSVCHLPEDHGR